MVFLTFYTFSKVQLQRNSHSNFHSTWSVFGSKNRSKSHPKRIKINIDISNDFWFHFWSDFGSILGPIWGQISGNFADFPDIPRKFPEFLVQFPDLMAPGRLDTLREPARTQPDSGNSGKFPPEPILDPKMDPKIDSKSIQNRSKIHVSGFRFHVSRFTFHVLVSILRWARWRGMPLATGYILLLELAHRKICNAKAGNVLSSRSCDGKAPCVCA